MPKLKKNQKELFPQRSLLKLKVYKLKKKLFNIHVYLIKRRKS